MKKIFTIIAGVVLAANVFAQAPQKMSYQAVIRNSDDQLVTNTQVGMQISILQGSANGTAVYVETLTPFTNANGLVSVEIGGGSGFNMIDWANDVYFIKTETDINGGTNYTITGTSQLLSVPYALHAREAESISGGLTETDPVFMASPAGGIVSDNITNWNIAYGWGNHADAGYLTSFTETDPVFGAHPASSITSGLMDNWNTAYSWGNHADAGYLTSFTETDPVFGAHPSSSITSGLMDNWSTAYSWGNHADAGYLTSFTETDPVFGAHPASSITSGLMDNWSTAYSWGNHADAGYLTSFTETDPVFGAHPASNVTSGLMDNWSTAYSWGNHADAGYLTSFSETDPVFGAHPASSITSGLMDNWNMAYSWGNHADAGYLTSFTELDPKVGANSVNYLSKWNGNSLVSSSIIDNGTNVGIGVSNPDKKLTVAGNVQIEADGIWEPGASARLYLGPDDNMWIEHIHSVGLVMETASGWPLYFRNGDDDRMCIDGTGNVGIGTINPASLLDVNGIISATGGNSSNWNTAYGWGNHADAGYLTSEVDGSVTNELQTLSISNDTVYLSNGGFVKIPEQKSIPALITQDDFSCTALKPYWTVTTTGSASVGYGWASMDAISLSTSGSNTIKLRSNRQKSVTEGKLIFTTVTYTYEDNNNAYGPLVRGLVNGTDRNNAIEFINISGNTIQARTVSNGVATTTNYAVGASVANLYSYTIIATDKKVEFYFEGTLIATHTTNIPTVPLNMYFDASTWTGNVPQCIDDAKFEIIRN